MLKTTMAERGEPEASWYYPDGRPCTGVTGSTTGQPRAVTVKDARALGLLPSVPNVLSVLARPALAQHRQHLAILAALNTPRQPYEPEAAWHGRIAEEAGRLGGESGGWAGHLRGQVAHYNAEDIFRAAGDVLDYLKPYETWYRASVLEMISAGTVARGEGYAARVELHAVLEHGGERRRAVIHAKPRKLQGRKGAVFHKEWALELAAAAAAVTEPGERLPLLVSLVLPADVPGPVQAKVWENGEAALAAFHACRTLWCWEKQYEGEAR